MKLLTDQWRDESFKMEIITDKRQFLKNTGKLSFIKLKNQMIQKGLKWKTATATIGQRLMENEKRNDDNCRNNEYDLMGIIS